MANGIGEAFNLDDWKRKKKAFDEAARKRKERRKRKRLHRERRKGSTALEHRQDKEVPTTSTWQNRSMKSKPPVIEPEKFQPDSVQIDHEKQQVLDGETNTFEALNDSEDVLMDEQRPNSAEFTLKQSATSTSSADVTTKSDQFTTIPEAVTVPSNTSVAREPEKTVGEQSRSKNEVPQASDQHDKATKSGLDKGPLTSVVSTVTDIAMADNSDTSNSRRNSIVMVDSISTSFTTSKAKDPVTTTESKLFYLENIHLFLSC